MASVNQNDEERIFPNSKKIMIGATSSLVDLKAELFKRKQEASTRFANQTRTKSSHDQPKWKQMADKLEAEGKLKEIKREPVKSKLDREAEREDEHLSENLRRSKEALERKARLYEQRYQQAKDGNTHHRSDSDLTSSDEGEDDQLVDFHRKVKAEKSEARQQREESPTPAVDYDDEDEWVEFTDSLGRTRKCLKKDLDHYKRLDEDTTRDLRSDDREEPRTSEADRDDDYSDYSDDEIGPRYPPEPPKEVKPVRYQDMQEGEIRQHGVSYFQFSADEDERRKQLYELNQLRDQTKKQRETKEQLKAKRRQALNDRLAKVAARKGVPFVPKESSSESDDEPSKFDTSDADLRDEAVVARKEIHAREWDVGKRDGAGRTVRRSDHISEHDEYVSNLRKPKDDELYSNFTRASDQSGINDAQPSSSTSKDRDEAPATSSKRAPGYSAKQYVKKLREDRDEEFAPPQSYFQAPPSLPPRRPQGFQTRQSTFKQRPIPSAPQNEPPNRSMPEQRNPGYTNFAREESTNSASNQPLNPDVTMPDVTTIINEQLSLLRNQTSK